MSRFVKLMLAFLAIILLLSATFSGVAAFFIGSRVLAEANNRVESDLNSAEEMYGAYSARLYDLLRLSADRFYLRDALLDGQVQVAAGELLGTMLAEDLDFLSVTDAHGKVLLRAGHSLALGDSVADDAVVAAVLMSGRPTVGNTVYSAERLAAEAPHMEAEARIGLVSADGTRPVDESVLDEGLMLVAAAPIVDYSGVVIGSLVRGVAAEPPGRDRRPDQRHSLRG